MRHYLYYILVGLIFLISCKNKKEASVVSTTGQVETSDMSLSFSSDSTVTLGGVIESNTTIDTPIKSVWTNARPLSAFSVMPDGDTAWWYGRGSADSIDALKKWEDASKAKRGNEITYSLAVDANGNIIEVLLYDSLGQTAIRKDGKWEIIDCERALEVVYKIDSIRNADYYIQYTPKKKPTGDFHLHTY